MRVLCVTGSRADYGSIEAVFSALGKRGIDVDLVTYCLDQLWIDRIKDEYDIAVLEGDRSEILRTAAELYLLKIPIAHLGGGDITEGSLDDGMRHAITKLSHLHFATCEESARRIIQLGEEPWRVHMVGEPAVDILEFELVEEFGKTPLLGSYILVVWHPNTLATEEQALIEATILANSLEVARGHRKVVVIGPNSDVGGRQIADFLRQWAEFTGNIYKETLPRHQYLGLLKFADCLVGNSSSGFYEAPSFGTPVVNIGDRQKGRISSGQVIEAKINIDDIVDAIQTVLLVPRAGMGNCYQTGNAADKIAEVIANIKDPKALLRKKFYEPKVSL